MAEESDDFGGRQGGGFGEDEGAGEDVDPLGAGIGDVDGVVGGVDGEAGGGGDIPGAEGVGGGAVAAGVAARGEVVDGRCGQQPYGAVFSSSR